MPVDELNSIVERVMEKFAMAPSESPILVATSGGPDSMCLLYVLHDAGHPVEVACLDHQTRNGESAIECGFVEDQAALLDVPFHTESRAVEEEARESGRSFEEYARDVRYQFLKRVAAKSGIGVIATGHHADDQAETVLMRILRGTTPTGLSGIPPVRTDEGFRIIRPLIGCTREHIHAYLEARGIPYRTDETNDDTQYVRNRVRHTLLPLLREEFNPRVCDALTRLAETQRLENELLAQLSADAYAACIERDRNVNREAFNELHIALQRRVVLMLAQANGVDAPFERISVATQFIRDGSTGAIVEIGKGVALRNDRNATAIVAPGTAAVDESIVPVAVPGSTCAFGKRFNVALLDEIPEETIADYCTPARQVFDANTLGRELAVRHRLPGDRLQPFGMSGTKKLKDYFIDAGVPAHERDKEILLVANESIAWVIGHVANAAFAVTPETSRVIEVSVEDASE